MSFFGVTYRTIEKVWNHPNADRLDLAQVNGTTFQFVVGRNQYKIGDEVIYFPVDAVLNPILIKNLGLEGKLSGKDKNRIKTVKLRGEISQGIVAGHIIVYDGDTGLCESFKKLYDEQGVEEFTRVLGVTKYDPPPILTNAGNLVAMPDGVSTYDIEGADNFPDIVEKLMDRKVSISEKLEGTNFWISISPCINANEIGEITFGQRHNTIQPIEGKEHGFWTIIKKQHLDWFVKYVATRPKYIGKRITLRGEFVGHGVQKNIYKLAGNEIYIFDILVDMKYLNPQEMIDQCVSYFDDRSLDLDKLEIICAPKLAHDVILRDWLAGKSIREASTGKSLLFQETIREGIVIKPMVEEEVLGFGRLFIKQRSPEYLALSDF